MFILQLYVYDYMVCWSMLNLTEFKDPSCFKTSAFFSGMKSTLSSSELGVSHTIQQSTETSQLVLIMLYSKNVAVALSHIVFHTGRKACKMESTGHLGEVVCL